MFNLITTDKVKEYMFLRFSSNHKLFKLSSSFDNIKDGERSKRTVGQ